MEDKKEIKVVTGDSSNLDISPIYKDIAKPSSKKPKNIVIPKTKEAQEKKENTSNN